MGWLSQPLDASQIHQHRKCPATCTPRSFACASFCHPDLQHTPQCAASVTADTQQCAQVLLMYCSCFYAVVSPAGALTEMQLCCTVICCVVGLTA